MKDITFGQLLEMLLYLSHQKKGALAKKLGYDISYISKWIKGRNLPTQNNISNICKITSEFIVESLNTISKQDLMSYFEIESEIKDDAELIDYIDRILKESYMNTVKNSKSNVYKSTQYQDNYNSVMHINPRLRRKYLSRDLGIYLSESGKLDIILSTNLYKLKSDDKVSIAEMKSILEEIKKYKQVKARVLTGFDGSEKDTILNTLLLIDMISTYPDLDFEIYNCNVDSSNILSVLKDRIFHSAIYASDGRCFLTNMSKERHIVDEAYYSFDEIIKNQGKLLVEKKNTLDLLKEKTYIQYIMGQNWKWILGSINEFFMPTDLFIELAREVFGEDESLLNELHQINAFLQNVIYKSNVNVLIYASELMRYISTGEILFFNRTVKLTLAQMKVHIKNIENIIKNHDSIEIKLIEDNFLDANVSATKPTVYLSKNLKLIKTEPMDKTNYFAIIKDLEFNKVCDDLFDKLWNSEEENLLSDKNDILDRISKALIYTRIMNGEIK